jgi:hypothetical protein
MPGDQAQLELGLNLNARPEGAIRALEQLDRKMIESKDVAEVMGTALEKVGRIFEIGLPWGLAAAGAAALGNAFDSAAEKAQKFYDKMEKLRDIQSDSSLKNIRGGVEGAQQAFEGAEEDRYYDVAKHPIKSLINMLNPAAWINAAGGSEEAPAQAQAELARQIGLTNTAEVGESAYQARQRSLKASGDEFTAQKEALQHDAADQIKGLQDQGFDLFKAQNRDQFIEQEKLHPGISDEEIAQKYLGYQKNRHWISTLYDQSQDPNAPQIQAVQSKLTSDLASAQKEEDWRNEQRQHQRDLTEATSNPEDRAAQIGWLRGDADKLETQAKGEGEEHRNQLLDQAAEERKRASEIELEVAQKNREQVAAASDLTRQRLDLAHATDLAPEQIKYHTERAEQLRKQAAVTVGPDREKLLNQSQEETNKATLAKRQLRDDQWELSDMQRERRETASKQQYDNLRGAMDHIKTSAIHEAGGGGRAYGPAVDKNAVYAERQINVLERIDQKIERFITKTGIAIAQ